MVAMHWMMDHPEIPSLIVMALLGILAGRWAAHLASRRSPETETQQYRLITPDGKAILVDVGPKEDLDVKVGAAIKQYEVDREGKISIANRPKAGAAL